MAVTERKRIHVPGALRVLGPGLITGAADDDPSGIATYSQAGAQFGFGLGWTLLVSYPLMVATQEISARIGCVTGHGVADAIRRHYPPWLLRGAVLLLLVANVLNLAADIRAMGSAVTLLVGGPAPLWVIILGATCAGLEIWISYERYAGILKWLTLSLLAYVGTVFAVRIPWSEAIVGLLVPRLSFSGGELTVLVAVLGTTISPYLFFWQSAQEAEEVRHRHGAKPLRFLPSAAPHELRRIRFDTLVGMGTSNVVAWFIIIACAATLNASGAGEIRSAEQAAEALRPVAGEFAATVFAIGIVGTGLLAVPVLAGSAAYAVGEAYGWRVGLDRRPREAKAFYAAIAAATGFGMLLAFTPLDPITALFWSAVVNGFLAPPLMATMMLIGSNPRVMGRLVLPRSLQLVGWISTGVMGVAVLAMLATGF
jgi:NRAMP (natural resistance-associated macrophage protein)-like metal ion transporter